MGSARPPRITVPWDRLRGRGAVRKGCSRIARLSPLVPDMGLTEIADAQIVVSSVWRYRGDLAERLRHGGVRARVIGTTPTTRAKMVGTSTRGAEIMAWLQCHASRPFVILDDDRDMDDLIGCLVQTSPEKGLTLPLAELALNQLVPRRFRTR